jgi:hypothetical protein
MKKLKNAFTTLKIEHRPIVAGNLLLHPFLSKWKDSCDVTNANILNFNGIYIGNSQFVTEEMLQSLKQIIKDFL